ncbi:MAG: DUF2059 domain-containing protein [Sphingomonadales bacterium]|nr:MAG: DUF2059 domain-containing protein [Sphingomonadales bacterium]
MIRNRIFAATSALAALALAPQPLAAQDTAPAAMANMFGKAEPLTTEQEARIPAAEQVVARIFPPGTYAKMMNDTMKPMMDNIMGSFMDVPVSEIAKLSGLPAEQLPQMGEGSLREVMAILDPAFEERTKLMSGMTMQLVSDMMVEIEPSYRAGLARAYASRFTETELADMAAYFATPTGAKYAAESMLINTDPQVMATMNEMMPTMMRLMPEMMAKAKEAEAQFPPQRSFSDLSQAEQARLAELLGTTVEALRESEPEARKTKST